MAELNTTYRALRSRRQHRNLPQTAPLAAKFESCKQAFESFCIVTRSIAPSDANAVENSFGKFLAWGNDSGASARSIDRTLRKTSSLSEMTDELLMSLYSKLQEGIETVQRTIVVENDNDDEALRGSIGSGDESSHSDLKVIADPEISGLLEYIERIVGCLMTLVPNLCDPFPVDTYSSNATPDDANADIYLASILFPRATKEMLERLGWANWRRRKHLKALQENRRPGMPLGELSNRHLKNRIKKNQFRDVAVDAFNFQKPGLKAEKAWSRPGLRTIPSFLAPSAVGGSASSVVDSILSSSVFSRGGSKEEGSEITVPEYEVVGMKHQTVPKPPIPLEEKRAFLCPYCNDEIDVGVNIKTTNDWEGHVFSDLEPYMCTFDDCIRAEKTYGVRDDWFRHELESHRIMKVWVCQSCVLEFSVVQEFEAHLREKHNSICGPSQMSMMVSLCMKHSELHVKEQICPLCPAKLDIEALKHHIAEHLEQLALTSVNGDESSEEDDSDEIGSQFSYGNASEGKTKLEILNDFVEEQLNYVLPEKKGPADREADKTNLDFVGDSDESDEEDSEDERLRAPSIKRPSDETRDWKLAHYLGNQAGPRDKLYNKGNRRARSPRGRMDLRFHDVPKSAPSTSAIGPLRTVSHPRDVDFVGRDADLANLYKILSISGRICTINGTGGIGKTATAIEYTFRYEQAYSYIFWTQAETRVGCADTFSLIAIALGLAPEGESQDRLIELGRDFLEMTEKKWLLIFDNVDEWADIEEYIPVNIAKTQGSVMVTSRDSDIGPTPIPVNYFRINLKEMTLDESRSLLMQGIQSEYRLERAKFHPEWKIAGQIASLAGLPLAISHIAGYVKASGCTLAEFLELWNEWRKNSLSARPPEASSNVALETIWSMGLSDLGVDALKLLKIMAFFDSDVIQKELLMNDHSASSLAFLHSSRLLGCRRMIADLTSRKLISVKKQDNQEFFSVHRLLQHRLLQDLEENVQEREAIFSLAFELIRERLPRPSLDAPDSVKWTVFKEYLPHVLTMQRIYDDGMPMIQPFVRLSELFRDGGIHLWQRGLIYDGLRLLNSAEAILDRIGECNCENCRRCNKDQLRIDINIGTALLIQYFGISHRSESKERFGKILEIRRKLASAAAPGTLTQDDEITLCNALADYANALLQFNNYGEAEPIYQECHEKYQQWGTEDDISFEYAKFNHHMALCRMYKGDFVEARALSEKAVELISRQAGQPQLKLRFKFDLGCILLQSGDAEKALEIQEQILTTRLHMQGSGKANYFTLQSYYAVGAIYAHLGRLDQAEKYMRMALAKAQERAGKRFWPDAAVARTEFHLSQILRQTDKDSAEADGLAAKARSVLSRLLPFDPLDGVAEEDEIAMFDHLQPVFGGRFTGTSLLKYVV